MKTFTKKSVAIVLAILMTFSTMVIGTMTSSAANGTLTQCTVYYVDTNNYVGSYTLKLNACLSNSENLWEQHDMTKTNETYQGHPIYKGTTHEKWGGLDVLQFQCYNGTSWVKQQVAFESWQTTSVFNNKMYFNGKWVDYKPDDNNSDKIFLNYYENGVHAWDTWDTEFKDNGNSTYTVTLPFNGTSISCGVYNQTKKQYQSVSSSTAVDLSTTKNGTYNLTSGTTRGSSLTFNGTESATIEFTYNLTSNTLSFKAETSEPGKEETVYFVNSGDWDVVKAYLYNDDGSIKNNDWPGLAMTNTGKKAGNDADIYSITYNANAGYTKVIFTNKDEGSDQTSGDSLADHVGQYYDWNTAKWYTNPADIKGVDTKLKTNAFLAGEFTTWAADPANEFMKKDASSTVGYISLELEANKDYQFKVIKDGSTWTSNTGTMTSDNCTGWVFSSDVNDNAKITTTVAGTYVFAYDTSNSQLSVTYPSDTENKTYLAGDFVDEWKTEYDLENGPVSIDLKANTTYEFKVNKEGTWLGNNGTMTSDNCTDWTFRTDTDNCKITTTVAGKYVFSFDAKTDKVSVVYPEFYTVTLNGAVQGYYTYQQVAKVTSDTKTAFLIDGQVVAVGTEYSFYVVGDIDVKTDPSLTTTSEYAELLLHNVYVEDGNVNMELVASAKVEDFQRMGVAFATSEQSEDAIKTAVEAVTEGTSVSGDIAVHNSDVDAANLSGQYQFVYAPYLSTQKAETVTNLYFYAYAVKADGTVIVSKVVDVNLANALS